MSKNSSAIAEEARVHQLKPGDVVYTHGELLCALDEQDLIWDDAESFRDTSISIIISVRVDESYKTNIFVTFFDGKTICEDAMKWDWRVMRVPRH